MRARFFAGNGYTLTGGVIGLAKSAFDFSLYLSYTGSSDSQDTTRAVTNMIFYTALGLGLGKALDSLSKIQRAMQPAVQPAAQPAVLDEEAPLLGDQQQPIIQI